MTGAEKMHKGQVEIDEELVRRLVDGQFPHWADLPIELFKSSGTVNAIYRLGPRMYVRLPIVQNWAHSLKAEGRWLPRMRPHLPYEIPEILGQGVPAGGYPFHWAVVGWIEGERWTNDGVRDEGEAAIDVARFFEAMQRIDTTGVEPIDTQFDIPLLEACDAWVRTSIESSRDLVDGEALTEAWEAALRLPAFDGPYVWIHGDFSAGNVLVRDGRLCAVIDWGNVHVGDAARDLAGLWGMLSWEARQVVRTTLGVDEATWLRARAWAINAVGGVNYYRYTNPSFQQGALRQIDAVLEDFRRDG